MRLDGAMKTDVARARSIIVDMLGPTVIEEADDGIYAQMYTGPALHIAAGADAVSGPRHRLQDVPAVSVKVVVASVMPQPDPVRVRG